MRLDGDIVSQESFSHLDLVVKTPPLDELSHLWTCEGLLNNDENLKMFLFSWLHQQKY